jgi:hypothetical protein
MRLRLAAVFTVVAVPAFCAEWNLVSCHTGLPCLVAGPALRQAKDLLVDLVGFEPTTSSMPFKKYQSLADSLAQNKRLSKRRRGLRWTPPGVHIRNGPKRALTRAVASRCCLLEQTTKTAS